MKKNTLSLKYLKLVTNFGAVIVGAGKGERLESDIPKCLIKIDKAPLILLSAWTFNQIPRIEAIVLVVPPGSEEMVKDAAQKWRLDKVTAVVPGGSRRQDSVLAGVNVLPEGINRVLIHDGARPFTSVQLIDNTIKSLEVHDVVTVAVPVTDTLHVNEYGRALPGPDRSQLVAAQTPQGIDRFFLLEAFKQCKAKKLTVTDEVSLVREVFSISAFIVDGEASNVKITHPEDLQYFRLQLEARVQRMNKFRVHPDSSG